MVDGSVGLEEARTNDDESFPGLLNNHDLSQAFLWEIMWETLQKDGCAKDLQLKKFLLCFKSF